MSGRPPATGALRLRIEAYGVRVGIELDHRRHLARLRPHLPPRWRSHGGSVQRRYALSLGAGGRVPSRPCALWIDGALAISGCEEDVLQVFESDIQRFVAESSLRRVFVHAGVVALRGRAVLIPGRSGSGKTTLVAELLKAGAVYYSDDCALLDDRGLVHPYPEPLAVRSQGRRSRVTARALGGRVGRRPLPVALVVVCPYRAGARWSPRRLSEGECAMKLFAHTVCARRRPAAALAALRQVALGCAAFAGERGEAVSVVASILEWCTNPPIGPNGGSHGPPVPPGLRERPAGSRGGRRGIRLRHRPEHRPLPQPQRRPGVEAL